MSPCGGGGDPSAMGASEVANLEQVGFVYFFDRLGVFAGRGSEGVESDGAAVELFDRDREQAAIGPVQSHRIDLKQFEGGAGDFEGNGSVGFHLAVIAYPFEQAVRDSGCAARSAGDFSGTIGVDRGIEQGGGAGNNCRQFVDFVKPEALHKAKASAKGSRERSGFGGCPNQGEGF